MRRTIGKYIRSFFWLAGIFFVGRYFLGFIDEISLSVIWPPVLFPDQAFVVIFIVLGSAVLSLAVIGYSCFRIADIFWERTCDETMESFFRLFCRKTAAR